ncbi:MAG TPA: hypothetical protein VJM75_03265 [Acidimicrobiales bacterium]|nr:hypothetical protein [Acidimicrobiales bacterium]
MNQIVAIGDCWLCGRTFLFDADAVPSVWVDSATMLAPPDGQAPPATAGREPVCYRCASSVTAVRLDRGVEDLHGERWGALS